MKRKMKYSEGSCSITSKSFSLSFRLISPGKQTLVIAFIIIFLLDCLAKDCFRSLGYILGSWNSLLRLLSRGREGEFSKIEDFGVLRSPLLEELWMLEA